MKKAKRKAAPEAAPVELPVGHVAAALLCDLQRLQVHASAFDKLYRAITALSKRPKYAQLEMHLKEEVDAL